MKSYALIIVAICAIFSACANPNNTHIHISDDPSYAIQQISGNTFKTQDARALLKEAKIIKRQFIKDTSALSGNVAKQWGSENIALPSASAYVKYSNNYKSKAIIDFESGKIRVETIDSTNPTQSLESAIAHTIMLPQDPSRVDLYSDSDFNFDGEPFLAGLIKDEKGNDITTQSAAKDYAKYLVANNLKTRHDSRNKLVSFVELQMVGDYKAKSSNRYEAIVQKYAKKYNIPPDLILAIIRTESNFNPYAVSGAPAFGLMQIVPSTAGADAYELINGKKGMPTKQMLFNPETNIEYGTAYLSILYNRYLNEVRDKQAQEYCVIAAYNAGAGLVLRTFHKDKIEAQKRINNLSAKKVYDMLTTKLDSAEGRRYLQKVSSFKKDYEHIK